MGETREEKRSAIFLPLPRPKSRAIEISLATFCICSTGCAFLHPPPFLTARARRNRERKRSLARPPRLPPPSKTKGGESHPLRPPAEEVHFQEGLESRASAFPEATGKASAAPPSSSSSSGGAYWAAFSPGWREVSEGDVCVERGRAP